MKKDFRLLSTCCGLLTMVPSMALAGEEDTSLFREGLSWTCSVQRIVDQDDTVELTDTLHCTFSGDTIINGRQYHKLMANGEFRAAVRQEGKKYYVDGGEEDILVCDFGVAEGDDFVTHFNYHFSISSIDIIQVRGRTYRRFWVSLTYKEGDYSEDPTPQFCYVEGIGPMMGVAETFLDVIAVNGRQYKMLSAEENGEVIFTYDDFFASPMQEQEYHPFVVDGKIWHCANIPANQPAPAELESYPYGGSLYTISGDTLIGDVEYKKVLCQDEYFYGDGELHYFCAVREKEMRVYCVVNEKDSESLLLDFSTPTEVLTLALGGLEWSRFNAHLKEHTNKEMRYHYSIGELLAPDKALIKTTWVESVGSLEDPFSIEMYSYKWDDAPCYLRAVVSCEDGGKVIFTLNDMAVPTSVTSISTNATETPLFDLQGRRVEGQPRSGLYIRDGRKTVVK